MQARAMYVLFPSIVVCALGIALPFAFRKPSSILSPLTEKTYASIPTPTNSHAPSPLPTLTPTPLPVTATPTPKTIFAPADLEQLFTKYGADYSVDSQLLKRIANCESGLNPNASNLDYAGLYQFSESLWSNTRSLMGQSTDSALRFNSEEAIKTAAFIISQKNLSIWPNCNR